MTAKEALEVLNLEIYMHTDESRKMKEAAKDLLQETIDKANKYDEKETPLKVITFIDSSDLMCNKCHNLMKIKTNYCDNCGHRLE